jgi:hypothetical protein
MKSVEKTKIFHRPGIKNTMRKGGKYFTFLRPKVCVILVA